MKRNIYNSVIGFILCLGISLRTTAQNAPVAAFTANNVNINTGQSVNFTDQSTNSPTSWNWTFTGGSPSSSTTQNPSNIVYNTSGCYQVSLTSSNAFGSDNETQICYVNVVSPGPSSFQRMVLAEEFANASCAPCAVNNPPYHLLLSNNLTKVVPLNYHVNFPGTDSMNLENPIDVSTRSIYYINYAVPNVYINGFMIGNGIPTAINQSRIDSAHAIAAHWAIDLSFNVSSDGDSVFVACTIIPDSSIISINNLKLQVSLTEREVNYLTPPGNNGETFFPWVMRKMLPNASGQNLNPSNVSNAYTYYFSEPIPGYVKNVCELGVVAFIQNNLTKSVEQSSQSYLPLYPVAAFTADNVNINTGQSVNFTDQSTNTPNSWNWTFTGGSPSSSSVQNPNNIVYNTPGCYEVSLTTSNTFGSDNETQICYINVSTAAAPVASFNASNTNITAGSCVNFNSTSSNNPTSFDWQFPGASNSPTDTSQSAFVCYNTPGCYAVTLTVSNAFGSDSFTDTCYINVSAAGNAPVAAFTANNVNISTGQVVNFTDLSSNAPTSWNWIFTGGSPSSSSLQNPNNIVYYTPGCYEVSLTSSNAFGNDGETQICYINVSSPGGPVISASGATTFCIGDSVTLTSNQSSGNLWSNGAFSQSITVFSSGAYNVSVVDSMGTTLTSNSILVTVSNIPVMPLLGNDVTQCGGSITLNAGAGYTNYLWSDGDTMQTATITQSGIYYVAITNACGTVQSDTVQVTINALPLAPIITANGPTSFCPGFALTLSSNYNTGNLWSTSQSSNTITIDTAATFSVSYTDTVGCTSTPASISTSFITNMAPPLFTISNNTLTTSPATVTISNNTPNLSQYNFLWNFGDGSNLIDNSATVNYTYGTNGVFHVSLTLLDPNTGCSITNYNPSNALQSVICNVVSNNSCGFTPITSPTGLINACVGGTVNISVNSSSYPLGSTFQWNKNGLPINGENSIAYNVTTNGFYTVTVFNLMGCPVISAPVQLVFNLPAPVPPLVSVSGQVGNCGQINATLTASGNFAGYVWNTGQISSSINVNQVGEYFTIGQSGVGCDASSAIVNISSSTLPVPQICMVTVDTVTNNAVIVWEKDFSTAIFAYGIYKEAALYSNLYQQIAVVAYDSLSEYTDINSDVNALAERYRITIIDTCGGETSYSDLVRPMGLKVFPGIGVQRVLSWNSYIGAIQNISSYLIYSGVDYSSLQVIGNVLPGALPFIDNNPVAGLNTVYRVQTILSQSCESTRTVRIRSKSNGTGNILTPFVQSLEEKREKAFFDFQVQPNPNNGNFDIILSQIPEESSMWWLEDIMGRKITIPVLINSVRIICNENLSAGVYLVRMNINQVDVQKKIIVR